MPAGGVDSLLQKVLEDVPELNIVDYQPNGWENWLTRFTVCMERIAFDSIPDGEKKYAFLSKLGEEGMTIFTTLHGPGKITYHQLLALFNDYFIPTNTRYLFFSVKQLADEPFKGFAKRLITFSYACGFGSLQDSIVRDVFIMNMNEKHFLIREQLRKLRDPSLKEVLATAEALQMKGSISIPMKQNNSPLQPSFVAPLHAPHALMASSFGLTTDNFTNKQAANVVGVQESEVEVSKFKSQFSQPYIVSGEVHPVEICAVSQTEAYIWLTQGEKKRNEFFKELNKLCYLSSGPPVVPKFLGQYAIFSQGNWYRVEVKLINNASSSAEVKFLDYGREGTIPFSDFHIINPALVEVDPMAMKVTFANVDDWRLCLNKQTAMFRFINSDNRWVVQVMDHSSDLPLNRDQKRYPNHGDDQCSSSLSSLKKLNDRQNQQGRVKKISQNVNRISDKNQTSKSVNNSRDVRSTSACGTNAHSTSNLYGQNTKLDNGMQSQPKGKRGSSDNRDDHGNIGQRVMNNNQRGKGNSIQPTRNTEVNDHITNRNGSSLDLRNGYHNLRSSEDGNLKAGHVESRSSNNSNNHNHNRRGHLERDFLQDENGGQQTARDSKFNRLGTQGPMNGLHERSLDGQSSCNSSWKDNLESSRNTLPDTTEYESDAQSSCSQMRNRSCASEENLPPIPMERFTEVIVSVVTDEGNILVVQPLSRVSNKTLPRPRIGMFCAAPFNHDWYRAKILSLNLQENRADIVYIDFGNKTTVNLKDLHTVPNELMKDKSIAFPIKPKNGRTLEPDEKVKIKLLSQDDQGVWLVEIKENEDEKIITANNEEPSFVNRRRTGMPAKNNKSHSNESSYTDVLTKELRRPQPPPIPRGKYTSVCVVYDGPEGTFAVTEDDVSDVTNINKMLIERADKCAPCCNPRLDRLYVAPFDDELFRAKVIGIHKNKEQVDVLFIDYGNIASVDVDSLLELPNDITEDVYTFKIKVDRSVGPMEVLAVTPVALDADGAWIVKEEDSSNL